MANKNGGWKSISELLAFFSLAVIAIVSFLGVFNWDLGTFGNILILIKDIFITVLIAVMAYNYTIGKTKGWRIAFWVLLIVTIILVFVGNGAISSMWK